MQYLNLLYKDAYKINDSIRILIPKVSEVIEHEAEYYSLVSTLTAMPIDLMVELDDAGIDFTAISEYELFLLMFSGVAKSDSSKLIFGDLDLSKFRLAENNNNKEPVLVDTENDIVIDKLIYYEISNALRKIHNIKKDIRKPGNEEAKKFLLERARAKKNKNRNRHSDSQLESLIVAMVNTEQYKYDYESTKELTIYQFNECVQQIIKKIDYSNKMYGVYTGSINVKDLKKDDLNWLSHKQ